MDICFHILATSFLPVQLLAAGNKPGNLNVQRTHIPRKLLCRVNVILPQKLKFTYKEQKDWEHIEDEIAELEETLSQLDKAMEDASSSYSRLQELMEEKEKTERILEEKMERWMYLSNLAEQIAAQK